MYYFLIALLAAAIISVLVYLLRKRIKDLRIANEKIATLTKEVTDAHVCVEMVVEEKSKELKDAYTSLDLALNEVAMVKRSNTK